MAKGGHPDEMKSLKKNNDSLKKQLENARKDIKRLEERVEVQEHASKEYNVLAPPLLEIITLATLD